MRGENLGKNLFRLRKIKQISQEELASKAGISRQAYVFIENGKSEPKTNTLLSLADTLNVKLQDLFAEPTHLNTIRFRSTKKYSSRERYIRDNIIYDTSKWLDEYNYLENTLNIKYKYKFGVNNKDPIKAAAEVRNQIGIKENEPIIDILNLIENKFIKILLIQSDLKKFFGLSIGKEDGGPAIVVNTFPEISVERQIFTVAHELAHILLHESSFKINEINEIDQEEEEANKFASYFLLPRNAFHKEWEEARGLHWVDAVLHIKRKYRISYLVILKRIVEEEIYDNTIYPKFAVDYKRKYGKNLKNHYEPEALENMVNKKEEPESLSHSDFLEDRLYTLVRNAYEKNKISLGKAAEILKKSMIEMRELSNNWIAVG